MSARTRITALGVALAAVALLAVPESLADERWIVEPGPEAKDAQKLGASEVARAQKLAKAKQYGDAVAVLEPLSRTLPAAVHDCNLALAYLRAGALTRAKLVWDLSGLRNGKRPTWCTGDVSTQLSTALRAAGYVPTTVDVVPTDAVLEVGGVAMRGMRTVWLPPGQASITASAPDRVTQTVQAAIAAPSTRVAITLEAPAPAVVEPDAGVPVTTSSAPADAAVPVVEAPPADAAPIAPTREGPPPLLVVNGRPVAYRYIALTTAVAGWLGAGLFGVLTVRARDDANSVYATDPAFAAKKDAYTAYRWMTVGSVGLGVVATAITLYLFATTDEPPPQSGVSLDLGGGTGESVGITYSGSFGGRW